MKHIAQYWLYYLVGAAIVIIILGKIFGWFKKPLREGEKCTRDGQQGTVTNGVCTVMGGPRPTGGGNGGGGNGGGASAARTGY